MSEPNARQLQCRNRWHYAPGLALACPVCGMTQSQLKDHPPPQTVGEARAAAQPQPAHGHRVQIKHFVGTDVEEVMREANAWLTKVSGDPRTQVAESLQMFEFAGKLIVAVFFATAL